MVVNRNVFLCCHLCSNILTGIIPILISTEPEIVKKYLHLVMNFVNFIYHRYSSSHVHYMYNMFHYTKIERSSFCIFLM